MTGDSKLVTKSVDDLIDNFFNLERMVGVVFWGRSGSYLFCSLLEGHPHTLQLPMYNWGMYYFSIVDLVSKFKDMDSTQKSEAILNLFPFITKEWNAEHNKKFSILGENKDDVMGAAKGAMIASLTYIITKLEKKIDQWTPGFLIRLLHIAYADATKRLPAIDNPILIFSIHCINSNVLSLLKKEFPDFKMITTIRNPLKTLDSHLKHHLFEEPVQDYMTIYRMVYEHHLSYNGTLLSGLSLANWKAIRFEDMHAKTEELMKKIAAWLEIPWDPILLRSTSNRLTWWFSKGHDYYTGVNPDIVNDTKTKYVRRIDSWKTYYLLNENYIRWGYNLNLSKKMISFLFFITFWLPPTILLKCYFYCLKNDLKAIKLFKRPSIFMSITIHFFHIWKDTLRLVLRSWGRKGKGSIIELL